MAINYQAKIDLIVSGLKDIEAAERRIKALVKEANKMKATTRAGALAQAGTRALAIEREQNTREGREGSRRAVKNAEQRLQLQSKLNSATDLYNRKLQQFNRAGGQANQDLQERVDRIRQAFEVGTKGGQRNLRLARALGTELGRVVEQQREFNRLKDLRTRGFETGRRSFERIEALESRGFAVTPRAREQAAGIFQAAKAGDQKAYNEAVRRAKATLDRLEREYRQAETAQKAANKAKRDVERAEKRLATETKRAADARKKRRSRRFQDIATGAGFPLLFGGGPVQALAGGLGGAFGGMGGSIAATAAVSQVQAFATQAAKAGQSLSSTGKALDFVREKSLFSTKEAEERARKLEKLGDVEGLAALLTEELTGAIGNEGVRSLQKLGETTDETTRLWSELTLQLFNLVSGPLNDFLKLVNNFLKGFTSESRLGSFRSGLNEKDRARFEEIFLDVRRKSVKGNAQQKARKGIGTGTSAQIEEAIRIAQAEGIRVPQAELIPITDADRDRFTPPKGKRQKRDRTPGLQAELQLQERLFVLNRGIANAVASKNKNAQAGLQIEIVLERLAAERAKIAASDLDAQDKVLKTRIAEVQADENIAAIVERKNQSEQKRAEAAAKTIEGLLNEQSLAQATLDGKLKEEQINQSIAKATKDMTEAERKKVEQVIRGTAALNDQVKALQFQKQVLDGVVNQVGTQLTGLFENLIFQTEDFNKSLNNVLKSLSSLLLKAGLSMLGGNDGVGIFSILSGNFGGKRANGGPVSGGTPYVVGERGPELFVPSRSGTVVPNNALGGNVNVVVNVTEGQTDTRGGSGQANQLGNAIAAAVQSELIKQKRPGGLLAS